LKKVMIGFRPGRKTQKPGYTIVLGQGVKEEYPIHLNTNLKRDMQLREKSHVRAK